MQEDQSVEEECARINEIMQKLYITMIPQRPPFVVVLRNLSVPHCHTQPPYHSFLGERRRFLMKGHGTHHPTCSGTLKSGAGEDVAVLV